MKEGTPVEQHLKNMNWRFQLQTCGDWSTNFWRRSSCDSALKFMKKFATFFTTLRKIEKGVESNCWPTFQNSSSISKVEKKGDTDRNLFDTTSYYSSLITYGRNMKQPKKTLSCNFRCENLKKKRKVVIIT